MNGSAFHKRRKAELTAPYLAGDLEETIVLNLNNPVSILSHNTSPHLILLSYFFRISFRYLSPSLAFDTSPWMKEAVPPFFSIWRATSISINSCPRGQQLILS
jgi:hypothetical protein